MIAIHKTIWVTVLCAGLVFLVYAQNENQDWVTETPDTSLTVPAIEIDTVTVAETDSSESNQTDEGSLFSNLIKPVLLIGVVGGLLILLYTQRGS